ncbi:MAG: hypothetical protein U0Y96_15445 [Candidatus Kapaibacterium sp.]|nr:hypothetical protein [Bacteroidota bacterium]
MPHRSIVQVMPFFVVEPIKTESQRMSQSLYITALRNSPASRGCVEAERMVPSGDSILFYYK